MNDLSVTFYELIVPKKHIHTQIYISRGFGRSIYYLFKDDFTPVCVSITDRDDDKL